MKLYSTTNYDLFNFIKGNRNINKQHLNTLVKEIQKENLLEFKPILVDKKYNIIDGQHRIRAAKQLGLPIYYLIRSECDISSIAALQTQLRWVTQDYIKLYSTGDRAEDYIMLQNYLETYKFQTFRVGLAFLGSVQELCAIIKANKFVFKWDLDLVSKDIAVYNRFLKFIKDNKIQPDRHFGKISFIRAFLRLIKAATFDKEKFFSKLAERWEYLRYRTSEKPYLDDLVNIYNYRRRIGFLNSDILYRQRPSKEYSRYSKEYR